MGRPIKFQIATQAASPIEFVSARVPPTLLIYGSRDHIVQAKYGRDLHARLTAVGARSKLVEIPWADHAFDFIPGGLGGQLALWHTEQFLEQDAALATLLLPFDRRALAHRRHVAADHALLAVGADRRHTEHEVVDVDVLQA